jgi:hypothetical protein
LIRTAGERDAGGGSRSRPGQGRLGPRPRDPAPAAPRPQAPRQHRAVALRGGRRRRHLLRRRPPRDRPGRRSLLHAEDSAGAIAVATSVANDGPHPTATGLTRLQARFYGDPAQVGKVLARGADGPITSEEAEALGLATIALDDLDFADELRIAVEERASLSPDALTGMEASLRFVGPETVETKIFGRLTAWQNWIFTRANSTGERGALTLYGQPERPAFQWNRT